VQRAGFGTKLAWLADRDQDVVIVARDDDEARGAARLAVAVGIRRLGGVLGGGMTTWRAERREVARIERVAVADLPARLEREPSLQLVDVREASEWREGHIAGSVHVPYHDIRSWPGALDRSLPVAAICASGQARGGGGVAAAALRRVGGGARHRRWGRDVGARRRGQWSRARSALRRAAVKPAYMGTVPSHARGRA